MLTDKAETIIETIEKLQYYRQGANSMPTLDWIGKDKVINHHNDVVLCQDLVQIKMSGSAC